MPALLRVAPSGWWWRSQNASQDLNPEAIRYLNRLSDLLFILGRVGNANGAKDVLWTPGRFAGDK